LLVLGLTACAGTVPTTPQVVAPATPPPRAERPVYQLGERWIRSDGLWELTRIESDRYVFTDERRREVHLGRDLVPAGWGRGYQEWDFRTFDEYAAPTLDWPLEVGRRGTRRGVWEFFEWQESPWERRTPPPPTSSFGRSREFAATRIPAIFNWTVETYEAVEVAAGRFDAFRLLFTVGALYPPGPEWSLRVWYAPAVHQWVKAEGRNAGLFGFQLVAVDRPEPATFEIALRTPTESAQLVAPRTAVTGTVRAGAGLARVVVTQDGAEVFHREAGGAREVALDVPVTAKEGKSLLLVTATDTAGETRQVARSVIYDPSGPRAAARAARDAALAARRAAADADAEHRATAAWTTAVERERAATASADEEDWTAAEAGSREAAEGFARAGRDALAAAALAAREAAVRRSREQTGEARRAADVAGASRLTASLWARALGAQGGGESALGRGDLDRAQALFADAERLYREAERESIQQAAAAERARLAALKRQLESAEQTAAAVAAARRQAEEAGAPHLAGPAMLSAQESEREGQAALDRQDYVRAETRLREAGRRYQEAARLAGIEAARLAALERERAETEKSRAGAARAEQAAEAAGALRFAPQGLAVAREREREAQAAALRQDQSKARELFEAARVAFEQAAEAARRAAVPPLRIAVAAPPDQAAVEQDSVVLAGVVSGGHGIRRVLVTVNGVEVRRLEPTSAEPGRALPLDVPVRLREGHNTLVVTAAEPDGTLHQEVRTVHYERPVPLTVAVRYPEDRARLTDEASVLAAVVSSSKGVARATVTLNGVQVHQHAERRAQKSLTLAVPLTLRPGPNAIVLTAVEPDGAVRHELRTVVYDPPRTAPPPVSLSGRAPIRWAVIVGVGRYEHPAIPRLRYAGRDAEAIHEILTGPGGFKKEHVLLLTDDTDRKPTLRNLKWALGTFLARSAQKEDTVLIFFAGHGAPEVDQRGVEHDGLTKYLVPVDADPDDLYSTGLPMDELQTIFERIEAERVVAFLDTCYSGAAGGRTFAARRTRSGSVDELFLERLARARGRAIVTASRPSEVSIELSELRHGLFTYVLLDALRGAADADRDRIVSLQEVYAYVEREVTRRSRAAGGSQHPVMKSELDGVMPLVTVP
jgi:hypothetical protein